MKNKGRNVQGYKFTYLNLSTVLSALESLTGQKAVASLRGIKVKVQLHKVGRLT